ncbi:MAG: glycogen/starch synthase [Candidatus Amoebophilus sp.]
MSSLRILYVASEIAPFLSTSNVGIFVGKLAPAMQEKNVDIRILVPRFGVINERKNKLHEVVRLSGISIKIGNETQNLSVKVTAIPGTRIQVYFIDNELYFHRKFVFNDKEGNFFEDNSERLIFICKGALETVKNLNWVPDVVHCHDWITSLIPLYLKTSLKQDPTFQRTKVLFNLYNTNFPGQFNGAFADKAKMNGMQEQEINQLASVGFAELMQIGAQYADMVIQSELINNTSLSALCAERNIPCITNNEEGIQEYLKLYQQLTELITQ